MVKPFKAVVDREIRAMIWTVTGDITDDVVGLHVAAVERQCSRHVELGPTYKAVITSSPI